MWGKLAKQSALYFYRFFGMLALGLAACRPSEPQPSLLSASPTPSWAPSLSPAGPTSTPLPTSTPRPTPTPSASRCEWLGEPARLPDLSTLRWEDRTLGPHRMRVLRGLPIPPILSSLTPDGHFLEVLFATEGGKALVALDLADTAHQLVRAFSRFCPLADPVLCMDPEWMRWDPTLTQRNRLPDGRRLRINEAGRVQVEDGKTLTLNTPVSFMAVYPAGGNSILNYDGMGLWRGTLQPPAWERIQDGQGRPLHGRWVLPVRSTDWALAVEPISEFVPLTVTPGPPQVEPGTRGSSPPTPTPHIPGPGEPFAFHFWRVPLKQGEPAVRLSTFRTEVIATDMPTPDPVLLRDGRHVVLYWPFMIVVEGIWSMSELVAVETGQRVAEGALGLPEGTVLVDGLAMADGRWVLGEVVDRRTRQGWGIWVASGEDLSRHWTFEGWRGAQAWHSDGKAVVVRAGSIGEPGRLGVLRLPPGAEGVRPLEGVQPPLGWAGDWVVGRAAEAPAKARAVDPEGQVVELDLSELGMFLQDVLGGRDRVWLVVGAVEPDRQCRYTLVEWALPTP